MLTVLLQVCIVLLIVGVVLWALAQFPIDPMIAKFIRVAVVVVCAIWLIMVLAGVLGVTPGVAWYPPGVRR